MRYVRRRLMRRFEFTFGLTGERGGISFGRGRVSKHTRPVFAVRLSGMGTAQSRPRNAGRRG